MMRWRVFAMALLMMASFNVSGEDHGLSKTPDGKEGGMLSVDPAVRQDPFFVDYPNSNSVAYVNAIHLSGLLKTWYKIDGFHVFRRDTSEYVGQLPHYHMGFPKSGSTTAYNAFEEVFPCMARVEKEPHFWIYKIRLQCEEREHVLNCESDKRSIMNQFSRYVSRNNKAIRTLLENGCAADDIFVIDGSQSQLWKWTYYKAAIKMDFAVFLHELTPAARFIGLVRGNTPAHIRSNFWFFNPNSTTVAYEAALRQALTFFHSFRDPDSGFCERLWHRAHRFGAVAKRFPAFGSSCTVARYTLLFGAESFFLTNLPSLLSCSDGFQQWFGTRHFNASFITAPNDVDASFIAKNAGSKLPATTFSGSSNNNKAAASSHKARCFPPMSRSASSSSPHLPSHISRLEEETAHELSRVNFPLLPRHNRSAT